MTIKLKFNTISLTESEIYQYLKKKHTICNIESLPQKMVSSIKRMNESTEQNEITPFIDLLQRADFPQNTKIRVGDNFAVLDFELMIAWKEIIVSGFTIPKRIVDIKNHTNGSINYITFDDGDRYPRLAPAVYNGKPISQAIYFKKQQDAESTLTMAMMAVPHGWEIDSSSINQ